MDINLKKKCNCLWKYKGIGEASAIELVNLGANITLIARNESKLLNVLNDLDKVKDKHIVLLRLILEILTN